MTSSLHSRTPSELRPMALDDMRDALDHLLHAATPLSTCRLLDCLRCASVDQRWLFLSSLDVSRVSGLAALATRAMELEPCGTDLLVSICEHVKPRDALLRHRPELLADLLDIWHAGEEAAEVAKRAVVALLRYPLAAQHAAVPLRLGELLKELVADLGVPSSDTAQAGASLLQLRQCMAGNAAACVGVMDKKTRDALDVALRKLLMQGNSTLLLASLQILAALVPLARRGGKQRSEADDAAKTMPPSLFCGDKAVKTLRLVASIVNEAFSRSASADEHSTDDLESLRIWQADAVDSILGVIDDADLATFASRKENAQVLKRLHEKLEVELSPGTILLASTFLHICGTRTTVHPPKQMHTRALRFSRLAVLHAEKRNVSLPLHLVFQRLIGAAQDDQIQLDVLRHASTILGQQESAASAGYAHVYAEMLSRIVPSTGLRELMKSNEHELSCILDDVKRFSGSPAQSGSHVELHQAVSKLLLRTDLVSHQSIFDDADGAMQLVDGLVATAIQVSSRELAAPPIEHARSMPLLQLAIEHLPGASRDWSSKLEQVLLADHRERNAAVQRQVAAICFDLEHRANDVETPLREANAQLNALRSELETCRATNVTLQAELDVSTERVRLCDAAATEQEQELRIRDARIKQLETTMTDLLQELEKTAQERDELESRVIDVTEEQRLARAHTEQLEIDRRELQSELDNLQDLLDSERASNGKLSEQLGRQATKLLDTTLRLEQADRALELAIEEHRDAIETLRSEKADLQRTLEAKTAAAKGEHQQHETVLRSEIEALELRNVEQARAVQSAEETTTALRAELIHLQQAAKKAEDDAASELTSRLQALEATHATKNAQRDAEHKTALADVQEQLKQAQERSISSAHQVGELEGKLGDVTTRLEASRAKARKAEALSRHLLNIVNGSLNASASQADPSASPAIPKPGQVLVAESDSSGTPPVARHVDQLVPDQQQQQQQRARKRKPSQPASPMAQRLHQRVVLSSPAPPVLSLHKTHSSPALRTADRSLRATKLPPQHQQENVVASRKLHKSTSLSLARRADTDNDLVSPDDDTWEASRILADLPPNVQTPR